MSEGHGVNTNEISINGESVKFNLSPVTEKAINDLKVALEEKIDAIVPGGGTVELIDSATSTSTTKAPTAKALKGVRDSVEGIVNTEIPVLKVAIDNKLIAPERDRLLLINDLHSEDPTEVILSALRRGYEFIWVSELINALEGKGTLPQKTAILTYDDGRIEQFTISHPVLVQYGIKSTFFLTTDYISGLPTHISLSPYPHLTWDNIRTMNATGLYEWQNHTRTHEGLTNQTPAQRIADLTQAQNTIMQEIGVKAPNAIAYPNGGFDHNCIADFKTLGFKVGFTTVGMKDSKLSTLSCHPFTFNRTLNANKSWLDEAMDDSFFYWGDDFIGGRNAGNKLKYWTTPPVGFGFDYNGEEVKLDSRVVATAQVLETTDFFRVRPADIIYCSFFTSSELQTAGNAGIRIAQYDASKTLISNIDLKQHTTSSTAARTDLETILGATTVYIKIQMWYDAEYNGIVHMKNAIFRRAYP